MRAHVLVLCLAFGLLPSIGFSAGLIDAIPADGTAVTYDFVQAGTATAGDTVNSIRATGTVRLAMVGTQNVANVKCRWMEVQLRLSQGRRGTFRVWKVLIPENDLKKGEDPLARAVKVYAARSKTAKEPRLVTSKRQRQVVLAQLRLFFPRCDTAKNRVDAVLKQKQKKTKSGNFICDCHVFDCYVDAYLFGSARHQASLVYRVWKHQESPFGVLAMDIFSELQEVVIPSPRASADFRLKRTTLSTTSQLTMTGTEKRVKSLFPQHR